jgi:integrase/recombinase XerD
MSASPYPVLYLNLLEYDGESFIKFYYKSNPQITKKLEQAEWIQYSHQYHCFVTPFSQDKLLLIKESFRDQAVIDTRYLRRKSQAPAGRTVITMGQPVLSTDFPKPLPKPMLRLMPFQHAVRLT